MSASITRASSPLEAIRASGVRVATVLYSAAFRLDQPDGWDAERPYAELAAEIMWPYVAGSIERRDFDAVVADHAALQRDVEVHADEHALARQLQITNRAFRHGACCPPALPAPLHPSRRYSPLATIFRSRSTQRFE